MHSTRKTKRKCTKWEDKSVVLRTFLIKFSGENFFLQTVESFLSFLIKSRSLLFQSFTFFALSESIWTISRMRKLRCWAARTQRNNFIASVAKFSFAFWRTFISNEHKTKFSCSFVLNGHKIFSTYNTEASRKVHNLEMSFMNWRKVLFLLQSKIVAKRQQRSKNYLVVTVLVFPVGEKTVFLCFFLAL